LNTPSLNRNFSGNYDSEIENETNAFQKSMQEQKFLKVLSGFSLKEYQIVAVAPSPGAAMLLSLRDTFKNPLMALLYTLFVLSAAFHAFNGFWTFLITWGVILSMNSQKVMRKIAFVGMILLSFLG